MAPEEWQRLGSSPGAFELFPCLVPGALFVIALVVALVTLDRLAGSLL